MTEEWLIEIDKFLRNEMNGSEKAAFQKKLTSNSAFNDMYEQKRKIIWALLQKDKTDIKKRIIRIRNEVERKKVHRMVFRRMAMAASVALFVGVGIGWLVFRSANNKRSIAHHQSNTEYFGLDAAADKAIISKLPLQIIVDNKKYSSANKIILKRINYEADLYLFQAPVLTIWTSDPDTLKNNHFSWMSTLQAGEEKNFLKIDSKFYPIKEHKSEEKLTPIQNDSLLLQINKIN